MRGKFSEHDDDDDEEEADWKDSYSDLMTDLLAVFVLLLSFAMMNQSIAASKASSASSDQSINIIAEGADGLLTSDTSIFDGSNGLLDGSDSNQSGQDDDSTEQQNNSIVQSLDTYIDEAELSEQLSVTMNGNNEIMLRIASSLLFESGKANINAKAEPMINKLSQILEEHGDSVNMVRIEGHTDNVPINSTQFASNWELSTSRAVNVLTRLLEISTLESNKFSAVGYSEYHPIADNNTEDGRNKNRRVDFIIETGSSK